MESVNLFSIGWKFSIPFFLVGIKTAVIICFVWGMLLITLLSIYLAKKQKLNPIHIVLEHVLIALAVVILTYFIGKLIGFLA